MSALTTFAIVGCSRSDDVLEQTHRQRARAADAVCGECRSSLEVDEATCRARFEWSPAGADCLRQTYEAQPTSIGPYLECSLAAMTDLADCLGEVIEDGCTDALLLQQQCLRDGQRAFEDCAVESPDAAEELVSCGD